MRTRWILAHLIAGSLVGPLLYLVALLAYADLQHRFGLTHVPITLVIADVVSVAVRIGSFGWFSSAVPRLSSA